MWIDMAGNTYITDLYLRKKGVSSKEDFVSASLSEYIKDAVREVLLENCEEEKVDGISKVYCLSKGYKYYYEGVTKKDIDFNKALVLNY
jgi:hypothetical protein